MRRKRYNDIPFLQRHRGKLLNNKHMENKNSVCSSRLAGIVAKYFGVSVDYVLTGKEEVAVAQEEHIDLKAEFNRIKKLLESGENAPLYFDGQPADQESINLLLDQIKISVALMERMRKK